jgi:hypothetical protein
MSLADSTFRQYGELYAKFMAYCAEQGVSALPADPWTVVCYVGALAEQGTWAEGSMQPIFSAINRVHRDAGAPPPAVGNHFLAACRKGLARAQAELCTRDSRIPLPAQAVVDIIEDGELSPDGDILTLRASCCLALCSLFVGRQDSAVHLRVGDIGIEVDAIWLRLEEKGKRHTAVRRVIRLPLSQQSVQGHPSILPRVAALLRRYLAARTLRVSSGTQPEFFFQLPGETRPTTTTMSRWLQTALSRVGVSAPAGFAYQGHSIRSGGASAMSAIAIPRHLTVWLGGWAAGSVTVDKHYIDPSVLPTPAAFALYGWALLRCFEADSGVVVRRVPLPDPLEEAATAS